MQVQRPLRKVTYAFPRTRQHNKPSGALDYIRLIDAPEGCNRARIGDWIVKADDGNRVFVVPESEFAANYEQYTGTEAPEVGTPTAPSEALDSTTEM